MQLPPTVTPFSSEELIAAVTAAYRSELGAPPASASVAVICAQVALETANGKACVQQNPGNFKRPDPNAGDYCVFLTTEWSGSPPAPHKVMQPFACYPSLAAGCEALLHSLYTRWPLAWTSVVAGDPLGFAKGLRQGGYYTAPLDQYAAGVQRWFGYYLARITGDANATLPEPVAFAPPDVTPDTPNGPDDPEGA